MEYKKTVDNVRKFEPAQHWPEHSAIIVEEFSDPATAELNQPFKENVFCICVPTSGEIRFKLNMQPRVMKTGQIAIFAPLSLIELNYLAPDSSVLSLVFSNEFFSTLGIYFRHPQLLQLFYSDEHAVFDIEPDEAQAILWMLERLKMLNKSGLERLYRSESIDFTFMTLLFEIGNSFKRNRFNRVKQMNRKEHLVLRFLELVGAHYKLEKNVQFYADKLFITRKYLTKVIKEVTGKTPLSFIEEAVFLEAKSLLANPAFSITEIAYALNFADRSGFQRFFKKHAQVSPTQFRG